MRSTLLLPDLGDEFTQASCTAHTSPTCPRGAFAYDLQQRCDDPGAAWPSSSSRGGARSFVSRTRPGWPRQPLPPHQDGEVPRFEGEALIRFRHILGGEVLEVRVRGESFRVVDIPTGFTHSIENIGQGELVTLFWASEVFDPDRPDTQFMAVQV